MSTSTSNVNISTDTFGGLVDKTNQICFALSNIIVTTAANAAGGTTSGNGYITATFGSNTLVATTALRGGTITAAANLNITSNAIFSGGSILSSAANVSFTGANTSITSTNITLGGTTTTISSNAIFSAVATHSASVMPNSNGVLLGNNTSRWEMYANTVNALVFNANTFSANSLAVSTVGLITSYVNTNLGTVGTKVLFSLPYATHRAFKVNISASTPTNSFQASTIDAIHNGTDVYYTTSGIIYSTTQFFTIDSVINGANVDIRVTPSVANVSVRALAQIIKE